MADQAMCPICFKLYPVCRLNDEWPTCPDCESEAITVDLVAMSDFLGRHTIADLRALLEKWNAASGFRETYKRQKQERIEHLIALKAALPEDAH